MTIETIDPIRGECFGCGNDLPIVFINFCPWCGAALTDRRFTLADLQEEQKAWVEHNFPGRKAYYSLLGVHEEIGELAEQPMAAGPMRLFKKVVEAAGRLAHSHLKAKQGIRGTPEEHKAKKEDAVADIVIFLSDYCTAENIDLQDAVQATWAEVKQRDWRKDPKKGGQ